MTAEKRYYVGSVLLTDAERNALKNCAKNNCRKMADQLRMYILQGLSRDGYLPKGV